MEKYEISTDSTSDFYVDEIKNAGLEYVFEKALKKLGLP